MNKTYKIQLPHNKEAQNIRTNIKDGTIEVEVELKDKWEPKDGDILSHKEGYIVIYAGTDVKTNAIITYVGCGRYGTLTLERSTGWGYTEDFYPATDSEKQLLFDALAKEGKMWDAQKKQVVDLPKPQVEAKECPTSLEKDIDWEERRYEIARQMLPVISDFKEFTCNGIAQRRISREDVAR